MPRSLANFIAAILFGAASLAYGQAQSNGQANAAAPAPGTTGNPANVPYIGANAPGGEGQPVRLARATGHVSNYDESKVPPYTLPDVLKMNDGRPVTSADMWFNQRRPEILKMYEEQIYGHVPATAPKVTWEVVKTEPARDGAAMMKTIVGRIGDKADGPKINLTLDLPANATGPVPVILCLNFNFGAAGPGGAGGARGARGPATAAAQAARGAAADAAPPFDLTGEILTKGWAYASIFNTDIQADNLAGLTSGVIGASFAPGQTERKPNEWGSISAWAWGISRCIDYFETDKSVNARQVAIQGTSRLGKTVLWASAEILRVAATFTAVGGELGAALARRDWGETVDDMAQNYPWQFAGNFQKFVGKWNDMPVDQHMLIALSAPRPLFINGGLTDQWSDPKGEFLAAVAAGPVYRLVGKKDLGTTSVPELDHPLIEGDLAFHYHHEGHAATPSDWQAFLKQLDRYFATPGTGK